MFHFLLHTLGLDNESSPWYAFWSGFGSDLSIVAAPVILYRKHNCHSRWCLRIGHHPTDNGYTVCHKHFRGNDANVG